MQSNFIPLMLLGVGVFLIGYFAGIAMNNFQCQINDYDVKNCIKQANDYNAQYLNIVNNKLNCERDFINPKDLNSPIIIGINGTNLTDLGNPYLQSVIQ